MVSLFRSHSPAIDYILGCLRCQQIKLVSINRCVELAVSYLYFSSTVHIAVISESAACSVIHSLALQCTSRLINMDVDL